MLRWITWHLAWHLAVYSVGAMVAIGMYYAVEPLFT